MQLKKEPNSQLGSNPGGVHYDSDNQKYYLKTPRDPKQAHVEVATSKLYNSVGINTLNPFIHNTESGTHVVTKWQTANPFGHPDKIKDHLGDSAENHIEMAKIHHMAVITKNHDIVGLDFDNLLHSNGKVISADQGGAMMFRAMGDKKEFGNDVDEIESFKVARRPTGKVFGQVHPMAHEVAAQEIKKHLTDDTIDDIVQAHSLGSEVSDTLKTRRDLLLKHYGQH
jgi:hypothetical protein